MSIDVEGLDMIVLESNDWKRYSPRYLLVECIGDTVEDIMQDKIYRFLSEKGYKIVGKTYRTLILRKI